MVALSGRKKPLRVLREPFVVAPPTGVSLRTSLKVTAFEHEFLVDVGALLGSLYRRELSALVGSGEKGVTPDWRRETKRALTADTSSRWAGTIIRAVEDQLRLSRMALVTDIGNLESNIACIREKAAIRVGERGSYRTQAERYAKLRRAEILQRRLDAAKTRAEWGRCHVTVGGNRLWSVGQTPERLAAAGLTRCEWEHRWSAARWFINANGETGVKYGNTTIRVVPNPDGTGTLVVKVPGALVSKYGSPVTFTHPVNMRVHRGPEWADRGAANQAVAYDIRYNPEKQRWYVNPSWAYPTPEYVPTVEQLGSQSRLAVDVNADHFAAFIVDPSGNPAGPPVTVPLPLAERTHGQRDAMLRHAITTLIRHAQRHNVNVFAIENLNFADARATGRETMGRGRRGKSFRRTVAGIPTAQFRDRLAGMAATAGMWIIAVDPAYTSQWGRQHWLTPLRQQPTTSGATSHHSAAVAIGRRSAGHPVKRAVCGPRLGQRTKTSQPTRHPTRTRCGTQHEHTECHPVPSTVSGVV